MNLTGFPITGFYVNRGESLRAM